jgi:hypothetical protein
MKNGILLLAASVAAYMPLALSAQTADSGVSHPELLAAMSQPSAPASTAKPTPATQPDSNAPAVAAMPANPDEDIVTRVPVRPGELADGTIFRTHLNDAISTDTTKPGTVFSARIVQDVMQDGRVIIPVGSSLIGRVTKATENRRYLGHAKLRLRPDEIVLPDGTHLMLHAQVIDTDSFTNTKADGEGTIVSRDNAKKSWAITGATTGTGAATGAIVGGGVGAVVGTVIGAGVGAGHFMMAHQIASLPKSSTVVFQLTEPMSIVPLHE